MSGFVRRRRARYAERMTPTPARSPASVVLLAGFGLFVGVLVAIVASSLARREQPTFSLTRDPRAGVRTPGTIDTLTIDARDGDTWRYVSLSRGEVLAPGDTAGWELAVRRYRLISWGQASDGDGDHVDRAAGARVDSAARWEATRYGRDTVNAALTSWYRYSMVTHLLESRRHRYTVETRDGERRIVEVLSYYCPGLVAGCLTIRSMSGR